MTNFTFGGMFFIQTLRLNFPLDRGPQQSKQRDENIRIPSNNLLLGQNVMITPCSRCNWFCFSLVEKPAGHLLANRYVWQSQSRNYFRQSFENCNEQQWQSAVYKSEIRLDRGRNCWKKEEIKGKSILATVNRLYPV